MSEEGWKSRGFHDVWGGSEITVIGSVARVMLEGEKKQPRRNSTDWSGVAEAYVECRTKACAISTDYLVESLVKLVLVKVVITAALIERISTLPNLQFLSFRGCMDPDNIFGDLESSSVRTLYLSVYSTSSLSVSCDRFPSLSELTIDYTARYIKGEVVWSRPAKFRVKDLETRALVEFSLFFYDSDAHRIPAIMWPQFAQIIRLGALLSAFEQVSTPRDYVLDVESSGKILFERQKILRTVPPRWRLFPYVNRDVLYAFIQRALLTSGSKAQVHLHGLLGHVAGFYTCPEKCPEWRDAAKPIAVGDRRVRFAAPAGCKIVAGKQFCKEPWSFDGRPGSSTIMSFFPRELVETPIHEYSINYPETCTKCANGGHKEAEIANRISLSRLPVEE